MSVSKTDSSSSVGLIPVKSSTSKVGSKHKNNYGRFAEKKVDVAMERYSQSSLSIDFVSADGDKVAINLQSVKYQKSMLSVGAKSTDSSLNGLVSYVKDQIVKKGERLIKEFFNKHGENDSDVENLNSEAGFGIPDYWNAENTSSRIVEFSVSFFGSFKGTKDEYYNRIKTAIEDGFKQAKQILGQMPSQITNLTDKTYDLVMKKLDSWYNQKSEVQKGTEV